MSAVSKPIPPVWTQTKYPKNSVVVADVVGVVVVSVVVGDVDVVAVVVAEVVVVGVDV